MQPVWSLHAYVTEYSCIKQLYIINTHAYKENMTYIYTMLYTSAFCRITKAKQTKDIQAKCVLITINSDMYIALLPNSEEKDL